MTSKNFSIFKIALRSSAAEVVKGFTLKAARELSLEDLLKFIEAEVEARKKVRRLGGEPGPKPKSSQNQETRLA